MINPTLFLLASLPALALAVVLLMLSRIFEQRELEIISREEIIEIVASTLLIVAISIIVFSNIGGTSLLDRITCFTFESFVDVDNKLSYDCSSFNASKEVQDILNNSYVTALYSYYSVYNFVSRIERGSAVSISASSSTSSLPPGATSIKDIIPGKVGEILSVVRVGSSSSLTPCAGYSTVAFLLRTFVLNNIYLFLSTLFSHMKLLSYINNAMLVFLTVGLLLRGFLFTRKFAGFLLAFAFALLLYPSLIFIFMGFVMYDYVDNGDFDYGGLNVSADSLKAEFGNVFFESDERLSIYTKAEGEIYYCKYLKAGGFKMDYDKTVKRPAEMVGVIAQKMINPSTSAVAEKLFLYVKLMIAEGLGVLSIISISAGLGRLLGVEISPWLLSSIARLRL